MITSIGIVGTPRELPEGYQTVDRAAGVNDLLRPLKVAVAFDHDRGCFAVDCGGADRRIGGLPVRARAHCATSRCSRRSACRARSILAGLALQAVVVALLAAVLGVILAQLLAPLFPMTVVVPMSALTWLLPVIAVVIGLLASLAGLRRAVAVDPALAFGGP